MATRDRVLPWRRNHEAATPAELTPLLASYRRRHPKGRVTDELPGQVRGAVERLGHRQAVAGQVLVRVVRAILVQELDDAPHLGPPPLEGGAFGQRDQVAQHPGVVNRDPSVEHRVVDPGQRRAQRGPDLHVAARNSPRQPRFAGQP